MGKKRKSIATKLDEVDRSMYASFSSAANSLSHLYTLSMTHHKLSFQAGQRHSLDKLYHWILRQQDTGSRLATLDILTYIQNELDCCGEEPCISPIAPQQHQQSQPVMHVTGSGFPSVTGFSGQMIVGQGLGSAHCDNQSKTLFSNSLSDPIRQIGEGGNYPGGLSMGSGNRSSEPSSLHQQSRDSAAFSSNDSAMDMHAD
ncbi:hypothetical protein Fmac_023718 [Flemingia macrophylla]|uniref:Holocarboxylase synthetase n=1 Tax=Flemingia macrophylla TaxID=520843 RepID=A0ABD1LMC0_9FABA